MVITLAVLGNNESARVIDMSVGIVVFPIGWILSRPFAKSGDA